MPPPLRRILCAAALLLGASARAAEPPPPETVSLRDAVLGALARNPALAVRREEIAQREARGLQAAGEFDPHLSALFNATRNRAPGVNREALTFQSYLRNAGVDSPALNDSLDPLATANVVRVDDFNYQLGLAQKLRNGIVFGPVASVNVNEGLSPVIAPLTTGRVSLVVQVPLLRGLGADSTGAREAAARGEAEVARLLYRHELAAQAARTAGAYWASRAAAEAAAIRRDTEARAADLLAAMRPLVTAAVLAPGALTQAEANLLEKHAVRLEADLAASTAHTELGRALGLAPAHLARTPRATDAFPAVPAALDGAPEKISAWIAFALAHRADHQAVRHSREPAALLARKAQRDLLPRLDLAVQAGYATLSAGRNALDGLSERRTGGNGALTVSLDWPLRNTLQRGELREARAREREAEARLAVLVGDIAGEVATAVREAALRAELVAAAERALAVAERAVRQERERLGLGETSLPDVIALENSLGEARLRLTAARAGFAVAVVRFRFAVGSLFAGQSAEGAFELANLTQLPASP
ncbi:MAG: hypothetical protein RLZZ15_801 [Verrucomicrobiota bacterium]|jgi:outer membrane protein TolC